MPGRDLFAEDVQPKGRDLFADPVQGEIQPKQDYGAIGNVGLEFASAVNRGAANLLDFFTVDQINNVLQLAGSESRAPTATEALESVGAVQGGFMEPGIGREIVRKSGEFVAPGGVAGATLRNIAKIAPKVPVESLKQSVLRSMGKTTAAQDVTGAALSGAGMESGGAIGEEIAGEKGKAVGQLVGSFGLPVAATLVKNTANKLITPNAKKLLQESAPTIEGLKDTARGVYERIDNLGAVVDSSRVSRLGRELGSIAKKEGFDPTLHPKVAVTLKRFSDISDDIPVSELDTLRKIAQSAASSIDSSEARLGKILINKIDDALDSLKPSDFKRGDGEVGSMYRDARQLWRRAKKAELLDDAFEKARNQASGFENGIRVQFRSILNNKKKLRGFTEEEKDAMRLVVQGGTAENIAKRLGKLGFGEGQATSMLMGSLGVAGGAAVGGAPGAVAVPLVGQVSRNLAQKLTRNNAQAANAIVRAGKNGMDVARAYLQTVPAKDRSAQELAELLIRPGVSISSMGLKLASLPKNSRKLVTDAVFFANTIDKVKDE